MCLSSNSGTNTYLCNNEKNEEQETIINDSPKMLHILVLHFVHGLEKPFTTKDTALR